MCFAFIHNKLEAIFIGKYTEKFDLWRIYAENCRLWEFKRSYNNNNILEWCNDFYLLTGLLYHTYTLRCLIHYSDVIASQIPGVPIVYSTVY